MSGGETSRRVAISLFAFVVVAWGINWVVAKIIVEQVPPLWAMAVRTTVAAVVLAPALFGAEQLVLPRRADWPIVLVISLFHMVGFAALMTTGLKHVSVGRSVVLGYTTPLWVAPVAWVLLKEPMPPRRIFGISLGLAGLILLFNPGSFDWRDRTVLLANGWLLLAALSWSVSILYTKVHRWTSTPLQLVLWQLSLAAAVLTGLALALEGLPQIRWTSGLVLAFIYNGVIGTALGYWAMVVVNRTFSAVTTSLGVLATPVVGMALSAAVLGERVDADLIIATTMILLGIAIGATAE